METPMRILPALALTLLMAPADSARADGTATDNLVAGPVMEIVTFRLVPDTSDTAFLAAAEGTAAPLRLQPGFLGRSLTRSADGLWTDHVLWSSMITATAAADAMMADPAFGPFMALIDGPTVTMRHDQLLWRMD